jgi:hypothetical protein
MTFFQFLGACARLLWGSVRVVLHITYIVCWKKDYVNHSLVTIHNDRDIPILLGCTCERLYYLDPTNRNRVDTLLSLASCHLCLDSLGVLDEKYPKEINYRELYESKKETEEERKLNRKGLGTYLGSVSICSKVIEFFSSEEEQEKPDTVPMSRNGSYNSYTTELN